VLVIETFQLLEIENRREVILKRQINVFKMIRAKSKSFFFLKTNHLRLTKIEAGQSALISKSLRPKMKI
jgi:hypothetical protein